MIIRVLDFESTGIPSETERHALVEVGWTDLTRIGDTWKVGYPKSHLVNPGRPIPSEASAIHHIRDEDVIGAISPDKACALLADTDAVAFAAHKMDFEQN